MGQLYFGRRGKWLVRHIEGTSMSSFPGKLADYTARPSPARFLPWVVTQAIAALPVMVKLSV